MAAEGRRSWIGANGRSWSQVIADSPAGSGCRAAGGRARGTVSVAAAGAHGLIDRLVGAAAAQMALQPVLDLLPGQFAVGLVKQGLGAGQEAGRAKRALEGLGFDELLLQSAEGFPGRGALYGLDAAAVQGIQGQDAAAHRF